MRNTALVTGCLLVLLVSCGRSRGRPDAGAPAAPPPPPVFDNTLASAASREAQADPRGTLVGTWSVDPRLTQEANADLDSTARRRLNQEILPGMGGVTVTYAADGTTVTTSGAREVSRATWKAVKVEPPSITVEVRAPREAPTTTTLEVVGPHQVRTRMDGLTLVLRRTGARPDEPRTADLPLADRIGQPQGRAVRTGTPATHAGSRGTAPAADMRGQDPSVRARVDAENARVEAMNRQVDAYNTGAPLHAGRELQEPTLPAQDTSARDALLKDPALTARDRAQLEKNARTEEHNRRVLREKAPLRVK